MAEGATVATPGVLYAEHVDEHGQTWSLALVRTRWTQDGQLILERTTPEDDGIDLLETGAWFIKRPELDAPATLRVEISDVNEDGDPTVINALLDKLVASGEAWGIEAREEFR